MLALAAVTTSGCRCIRLLRLPLLAGSRAACAGRVRAGRVVLDVWKLLTLTSSRSLQHPACLARSHYSFLPFSSSRAFIMMWRHCIHSPEVARLQCTNHSVFPAAPAVWSRQAADFHLHSTVYTPTLQGAEKVPPSDFFLQFSQQTHVISVRNFTNIFSHPMRTWWYYHQSIRIRLLYFKVIRITVAPPSDFSVLENFRRKTHCWKSHAEPNAKELFWFHYRRNITGPVLTATSHSYGNGQNSTLPHKIQNPLTVHDKTLHHWLRP